MTTRKTLTALGVAGLTLVGADFLAWHVATDRLRAALTAFQARAASQGWHLTAASEREAGFPVTAALVLREARLAQTGGFAWRAGRVRIDVSVLRWGVVRITADGTQGMTLPGNAPLAFDGPITATVPWRRAATALRFHIGALRVPTKQGTLLLRAATATVTRGATETSLAVVAGPVVVPPALDAGLGPEISRITLAARLRPNWPGGNGAAAARAWQGQGGALRLDRLDLAWGAAWASASGRLGLDDDLQPVAHLALRLRDKAALLNALVQSGTISPGAALAANAVLALLAPAQGDGAALPVEIKHDRLMAARIPLARLPHLAWGGGE